MKATSLITIFLVAGLLATQGCLPATSRDAFVGDATEIKCDGVWNVCLGQVAGCLLDENHYVTGAFPGSRKVLVETPPGDWKIRVKLFLDPEVTPRYPGTETEISWYEPGCADQYRYQMSSDTSTTGDFFERAGRDNVFEVEHDVVESGDHLVTVYSDATTRYAIKVKVLKTR